MDSIQLTFLLNNFFRNVDSVFSLKDLQNYLKKHKFKVNDKVLIHNLMEDSNIIPLRDSNYITRSAIFNGSFFTVKPSKLEIENNILIIGHRFMPFLNPEEMPHEYIVNFLGSEISKKEMSFDTYKITPFYELFGTEYIPHFVSNDPANYDLDYSVVAECGLPKTVKLTVLDCSSLYKFFEMKYGDRIACVVTDWENSIVEITPMPNEKNNPFQDTKDDKKRRKWYENAEKGLLKVFENCGPCSSIERQLMWLFITCSQELFINESGSIEELIKKSKLIGIEPYGVETRLWRKGEDIPLKDSFDEQLHFYSSENDDFSEDEDNIPNYILKSFILDALYRKDNDIDALYDRIMGVFNIISDKDKRNFLLQLKKNHAIISKEYNWFADHYVGQFRTFALDLYVKLYELKNDLKTIEERIDTLPSQPMVIYVQLVEHVSRLLAAFQEPELISDEEIAAVASSLDGMKFSFEEVAEILTSEIKNRQKEMFSVIKMED